MLDGTPWGVGACPGEALAQTIAAMDRMQMPEEDRELDDGFIVQVVATFPEDQEAEALAALGLDWGMEPEER